jgi:hypothetical protein
MEKIDVAASWAEQLKVESQRFLKLQSDRERLELKFSLWIREPYPERAATRLLPEVIDRK